MGEWYKEIATKEETREYINNQFKEKITITYPPDIGVIYGKLLAIKITEDNKCHIILQRYSDDVTPVKKTEEAFRYREISLLFDLR